MAYTPMAGKWTHTQDMALPQVLVLLVQHKTHNTAYISHSNAYITQGNVENRTDKLTTLEKKLKKGVDDDQRA